MVLASLMTLFFSGCGCGKNGENSADITATNSVPSRVEDQAYLDDLKSHRDAQLVVARERNQLMKEIDAAIARVKSDLPADAGEDELKQALEQDDEWQALVKRNEMSNTNVLQVLAEPREAVRARMIREREEMRAATIGAESGSAATK